MRKTNYFKKSLVISILMSGPYSVANASPEGAWAQVGAYGYGVANILQIHGGEWVYKNQLQRSTASPVAVVIGVRTQPDEVQFFSIHEERALWEMEQKIISDEAAALTKRVVQRTTKPLVWPKVVVRDGEICVPDFQFANSDDWKSHLVCTAKSQ